MATIARQNPETRPATQECCSIGDMAYVSTKKSIAIYPIHVYDFLTCASTSVILTHTSLRLKLI